MVNRDENFLSREENEEEKLLIRGEADPGRKFLLNSGLVHYHTVYQAAVTLSAKLRSVFLSKLTSLYNVYPIVIKNQRRVI